MSHTHRSTSRPQPKHRTLHHAMTLLELLMALAITGIIVVAISSMMYGVTTGTASVDGIRVIVAKSKAVTARIDHAVMSGKRILDSGDDFILIWADDPNMDGLPAACELLLIEHDTSSDELISYRWDPTKTAKQELFLDSGNSQIHYHGSWGGFPNPGGCSPYNTSDYKSATSASGNYMDITFSGSEIRIIAPYKWKGGTGYVYVDGQYIDQIIFFKAGLKISNQITCPDEVFRYDGFPSGTHTLRMDQLTYGGGAGIFVDCIYIENSAANWKYDLAGDFTSAAQTLKTHSDCLTQTIATGILDFSLQVNHADPVQASVANYSITFQTGRTVTTIRSVAKIRYP